MLRQWIFLINPFISATDTSYRKMKQIGDYTLAALAAATATGAINDLLAELSPLVEAYNKAYDTWLNQQGLQKGQTQSLTDLLKQLGSETIQEWDLAVQNAYRQNTPQYMALMPRRRQPFQNGSQQDRITAVGALSLAIGSDAALQTLKTEVDSMHDALVNANHSQKGSKSIKSASSDELEADRIALGIGLYGVLGALMHLYKETPESIGAYFLLEELRNREQTSFQHEVDGGETVLVFTRTLEDDEQLKFASGNTALRAALVYNKNAAMPLNAFTIEANVTETIAPGVLGEKGNRFLIVKNTSATEKSTCKIDIV